MISLMTTSSYRDTAKTAYHTAIAKADAAFARDTRKADSFSADERDRARAAADRKQSKAYDRAHAAYRASFAQGHA